jgi:two-component system sensor histidine kinase PilS (NtrC family)
VRAANPAARSLLAAEGMAPPAPFELRGHPAWAALAEAVERALSEADWPEAGRELSLRFGPGLTRNLRLRARFTRPLALDDDMAAGEPHCLLLLEDVRTAQSRQRQEKLAAMGRVSAGIAHEIRNPLAAISQANALLLEGELTAPQRRLAQMVADNAKRLEGIVDDVMEVAPGAAPAARAIDAVAEIGAAAAEWARTAQWAPTAGSRLRIELPPSPLGVVFDPEHLRRVLVNLLDNAGRHASGEPGAVLLQLVARDEEVALLRVGSDGPAIAPEVEPHLFEPFFSTRSRGSGLGLYICRELCARYGAGIEYRLQTAGTRWRNQFVVAMRRGDLAVDDAGPPAPR